MKNLIALSLCVILGCATTGTDEDLQAKIRRIGNVAELAAYTGSAVWLADHPNDRPSFEAAIKAIDAMASTNNFDPVAFQQALQWLPIKELKSDKAVILIGSAIMLYEMELAQVVEIDRRLYVSAIAGRVRSGISRALQIPTK